MSGRPELPCFPPEEAASWRRVRRYAVPRRMIERATERRTAGDWRGACAAAGVDVDIDLPEVAEHCGDDVAAALADDLRHLVPDLVRWHLPRVLGGRTTLDTDRTVVLARYRPVRAGEGPRSTPYLHLTTPAMLEGPQRITLRFRTVADEKSAGVFGSPTEDWRYARHLWDARHTAELRERCGGGTERPPFFHTDGRPRRTDELPTADPGPGDAAARAEWVTLLHQKGEVEAAFTAAGIEVDLTPPAGGPGWYRADPTELLGRLALDHTRLEREVRRLKDEGVGDRFLVVGDWRTRILLEPTATGLGVRAVDRGEAKGVPFLAGALWRRLPDLDLLHVGGVEPEHLHPLVREALFPDLRVADGTGGPPGPAVPEPVRVRCRGEWHEVGFRPGGLLRMPHSDEEQQRERALRAFGGAVAGCFAVEQTWASGDGRLPKALRAQRQDLFLRAQHGDTHGVLHLLDAGVDPRVRDASGRSLLHVLHLLDHEPLLPRLLAAGLDLEARDQRDRTPLFVAVNDGGSRALVEALLAAGARIDVEDQMELSLAQVIRRYKRSDLAFLRKRVREEHPGLGADWWDEYMDRNEQEEADDHEPVEPEAEADEPEPYEPEPDEPGFAMYSKEPPF
ncbi:ankyrin repeat domain-containing protein [Streptomyces sp. AC558_RSS880]|uniref:ankyrin repeat domain-containing protein n=1 Tax=Streptomyces sp. AC558_RSS880 TaxID=2823687 RepID=UPI001C242C61|nr:ankyrin repeat domain-containing protein [Streptomyces sp. AC558_RSS880]